MIWDRIIHPGQAEDPVEEWGGISYSLEALGAALPQGWMARPIMRLGEDLAGHALSYLSSIPRLDIGPGIQVTPGTNPRVELRYRDRENRMEIPTGWVPPWEWTELEPQVRDLDALYVNFITGQELGLETAVRLRDAVAGPTYADLHTLFAEVSSSGLRFTRTLPSWRDWFQSFDVIQVNQDEFRLVSGSIEGSWREAAVIVGSKPGLIAVTMGSEGAAYIAGDDLPPDRASWKGRRGLQREGRPTRRGVVPVPEVNFPIDPTGCGDVWGATFFARLLAGEGTEGAMATANRMAFEKLRHSGARGLHKRLPGFSTGR